MSIAVSTKGNTFLLSTKSTSYAFGVDDQGLLRHLYWGKKLPSVDELELPELTEVSTNDPVYEITKEEFPVHGGLRYKEHCLKATFADGTRELVRCVPGTELDVLSGLGNGFDPARAGAHPVLAGGGIGIAPLYGLAQRMRDAGQAPHCGAGLPLRQGCVLPGGVCLPGLPPPHCHRGRLPGHPGLCHRLHPQRAGVRLCPLLRPPAHAQGSPQPAPAH